HEAAAQNAAVRDVHEAAVQHAAVHDVHVALTASNHDVLEVQTEGLRSSEFTPV
ncbi:MAG: hypothetical protein K0Q73_4629, partial [Paenibacillus sp.]|nr:hypothetical protein [Paenibacillus sp.]